MTWVFHESDVRGFDRLVLLALADEAGDDGGDCYPSMRRIANKARVGVGTVPGVLLRLEQAGALVVERPERKGRGAFNRYTVVMTKSSGAERFDDDTTRGNVQERAAALRDSARTQDPRPDDSDSASSSDTVDDDAARLCERLADAIESHRGGEDRPAVTDRWHNDMRLLLTRGPKELAKPEPVSTERVERGIAYTFRALSTPGPDGFCWANQVRSPAALRKHWTKIRDAARNAARRQTVVEFGPPLAEDQAHDVVMARQFDRTCKSGECDGSGWLDEEFDPFNAGGSPSVARPCPSCRPPSTQATA